MIKSHPPLMLLKPFQRKEMDKSYNLYNFNQNSPEFLKSEIEKQRLYVLSKNLENCGKLHEVKWSCKKCEGEGHNNILSKKNIYLTCGIRYCNKPKCVNERFANQLNKLKALPRFKKLNNLFHFVIGFEKIDLKDFKKSKKSYDTIINKYFSRLRNKKLNIKCFKVLDLSMGKDLDGKYYLHYHFMAIPFKSSEMRNNLILMHDVKKKLIESNGIKFNLKSFGLKQKSALFSYLSLRSIGMYKKHESKEINYKIKTARTLNDLIKSGKFFFLNEILSKEDYIKNFYGLRHISFIGDNYLCFCCNKDFPTKKVLKVKEKGKREKYMCPFCFSLEVSKFLPQSSIIAHNIISKHPNKCHIHGFLDRCDLRLEITPIIPPPDSFNLKYKAPEDDIFKIVDFRISLNYSQLVKVALKNYKEGKNN